MIAIPEKLLIKYLSATVCPLPRPFMTSAASAISQSLSKPAFTFHAHPPPWPSPSRIPSARPQLPRSSILSFSLPSSGSTPHSFLLPQPTIPTPPHHPPNNIISLTKKSKPLLQHRLLLLFQILPVRRAVFLLEGGGRKGARGVAAGEYWSGKKYGG